MCPIDTRIYHRDDNILTFVSVRHPRRRWRNSQIVSIISIEKISADVRHALVEARLKNFVRMNLLHARHVCDCRHRGFRNRQRHAVVNQRITQRHIAGNVAGCVFDCDRLHLRIDAAALQLVKKLILHAAQVVAIRLNLIV